MPLRPSLPRAAIKVVATLLALNGAPAASFAQPPQPGDGRPGAPCRIAVLGDSLTAGYGVALDEAFPARLEAELRARGLPCAVSDAGVSGDTSAGGRARLAWVLADRPSHLVVELGGNDGLRALPVEQLEANLAAIIEGARAAGVRVFLAGMLAPPNLGREYTDAFRQIFLDLANRYDVPLYPFFLDGAIAATGLMQPDGIHPTAQGVEEIVRRISIPISSWLKDTGVVPDR